MWILSILILILILSIIILIHEFGHFIWAKKFGVHIYEFSMGMGPIIFTHKGKKDNINYNIRAFPIGGFVAMAGEVYDDDDKIKKEKLMCNKPWYQRLIILVAGVTNNFILAIVVLFFSALIWGSTVNEPRITEVIKDSPMEKAGIVAGDTIVAVNGKKASNWDKTQILLIYKSKGNKYKLDIKHEDGSTGTYYVKPEITKKGKEEVRLFGFKVEAKEEHGFVNAVKYSFKKFATVVDTMALTIGGLFTGKLSLKSLSGPVGMYEVVNQGIGQGLNYMLYLLAFLSINVGFLNILPFPAFDGGRVLFLVIEKIKGSKVNAELENKFHTVGFILLMILMVYITIQDIIRFF